MLALLASAGCAASSERFRSESAELDRAIAEDRQTARRDQATLFPPEEALSLDALIGAVLDRNPSIEAARLGWQAALASYPNATSFEDPTLAYTIAPLSIGSDEVDFGHAVEISQPLPFPGKRALRGEVVVAEAAAARHDYESVRLKLAAMAARLYFDLYATERAIEIYLEFEKELEAHRETLTAHLAAGHAWQDEALKVDVDLGEATQTRLDLTGQREVVRAQMNELLHRAPADPLPPMPASLAIPAPVTETSAELEAVALSERPELAAAGARRDRETASIAVANRDFYPDFRVMGTYNSMWPQLEHELMVGIAVTLPIWRGRRHAAVNSARAREQGAASGLEAATSQVRGELHRAMATLSAAQSIAASYTDAIMPAAKSRAEAVRVGLESGRTSFIDVLDADHDWLTARLKYEQALANVNKRRADLEVALGRLAPKHDGGER